MLFVLVWLCLIYACVRVSALSGRAEEALFWLLKPACWLRHKPKGSVQAERREKYVHIKILPIYIIHSSSVSNVSHNFYVAV